LNIYVAAPITQVHVACLIAQALTADGFTVTSSWHSLVQSTDRSPLDPRVRQDVLATNLSDLHRAALVVAWTGAGIPKATYSEIGWALARGKRVVWIQNSEGGETNIFDADPGVTILRETDTDAVVRTVRGVVGEMRAAA